MSKRGMYVVLVGAFWLLGLLGFSGTLLGQSLTTDKAQLDFGEVDEGSSESLEIVVTNNSDEPIQIIDIQFFDTFQSPAFYTEESEFILPAQSNKTIEISFAPIHNIVHNTECFLVTERQGAFAIDLIGAGHYPDSYYDPTEDLSGEDLKDILTSLTGSGYNSLGYNSARDEMYLEFDNQKENGQNALVNTIECVYTGQVRTDYANRSELQGMGFNCEHTWPQSKGASSEPMKSDIHHLFPSEADVNSRRGDRRLGMVSNPTWEEGGSKQGPANSDLFEPRDEQKGPSARAMLYFAVRYQDEENLSLNWLTTQESTFRLWCNEFSPTEAEMIRNEAIYSVQNNRNPFVDYPQLVERIGSFTTDGDIEEKELVQSDEIIDFGYVEENNTYAYSFVLYNDGTEAIELSDFELDGATAFNFEEDPESTIELEPGEDYTVNVSLDSGDNGSFLGALNFNHTAVEDGHSAVPLYANYNVGNLIGELTENSVELYPNPAQNYINIQITQTPNLNRLLTIYDRTGQTIYQEVVEEKSFHNVSLEKFPNGIYWLQLKVGDQSIVKPFVVQK